ncbi:MAG: glycosyltransferase [Ferruginibacter sp.]
MPLNPLLLLLFSILIALLLFLYMMLLMQYRRAWFRTDNIGPSLTNQATIPFLSVIVAVRNEEERIDTLLTHLLSQHYTENRMEIIIVDDHSTDQTAIRVQSYTDPRIRLLQMTEVNNTTVAFKKLALQTAVAASKGSYIVTTDADCQMGPYWLRTIADTILHEKPAMMVMPVDMFRSWRPLALFQSLDFLSLQGITMALFGLKTPALCNGANMAYSKECFEAIGGYTGLTHMASGDDMMLLEKCNRQFPGRVVYLKNKHVIVHTDPEPTLGAFVQQRIRWSGKMHQTGYSGIKPVFLLVGFLNAGLLLFGLSLFLLPATDRIAMADMGLLFLLIKTMVELYFLFPVARFFGRVRMLWFFPVAQPVHILYTVVAGLLSFRKTYSWKGRQVR